MRDERKYTREEMIMGWRRREESEIKREKSVSSTGRCRERKDKLEEVWLSDILVYYHKVELWLHSQTDGFNPH